MRICFSASPPENVPAGGGAKFIIGFKKYLTERGCTIENGFDVNNPPDLIFMVDPRRLQYSRNWLTIEHIRYMQDKLKMDIPIIHRLNDIGEPKDRPKNYVPNMIELANRSTCAIYVSEFVKNYYGDVIKAPSHVIHNGVDEELFTLKEYEFDKIRLVTHHWSNNALKGWDIYEQIDKWLDDRKDIEFFFIGKTPDIPLKNIKVFPPTHGIEMVNIMKKANIYVTASRYEPCGNHYIEGVACGLPLLYHKEGGGVLSMSEYGLGYKNFEDFKTQLENISLQHEQYYDTIKNKFNFYHNVIFEKYYTIIKNIINEVN